MSRPMTSSVSTLSGCVANSHQAMHLVSSTPSKIPYGGFSPVRLQTSLTPQPPSRALSHSLIGCHCSCPRPQRFTRKRTCVQAAHPASDSTYPVQWPLAPLPVILSGGLFAYYGHIRASESIPAASGLFPRGLAHQRPIQKVPNVLC